LIFQHNCYLIEDATWWPMNTMSNSLVFSGSVLHLATSLSFVFTASVKCRQVQKRKQTSPSAAIPSLD